MAGKWMNMGKQLGRLAVEHGPRLYKQLQQSGAVDRAKGALTQQSGRPAPAPVPGRPVASRTTPTAQRARTIEYSPALDGRADPGEIVWTWVEYEEDASQGKDRPVLVVGREGATLLGLMLSSNGDRDGHRDWVGIGTGSWDRQNRPSWIRLDRILDVPEDGIRREGAILERSRFDQVASRLRADFGWA
ncbi:type II toxin-antitoxin system PemK/MazF family toxin [Rhodococcus sp. SMB37]|uniref:type II toxin-antitoxin system PemK/MazF family toxin n=1 Tax=Rhodococcus sp. SMB37 TaxID=2512213 RepID=UPI0018EE9B9B|nr:type II toxin-antitoxin system PemK/MazF family toxin [Rhodococcus sp. SMB37]